MPWCRHLRPKKTSIPTSTVFPAPWTPFRPKKSGGLSSFPAHFCWWRWTCSWMNCRQGSNVLGEILYIAIQLTNDAHKTSVDLKWELYICQMSGAGYFLENRVSNVFETPVTFPFDYTAATEVTDDFGVIHSMWVHIANSCVVRSMFPWLRWLGRRWVVR